MDAGEFLEVLNRVDIDEVSRKTLAKNTEVIANLNASQMAQGRRATGTKIRPDYHPLTIELKQAKSGLAAVTDRVTLFDTGSHYRQLYAEVEGDDLEVGSRDLKSEALQKKYGAIYGLDEESAEELVNNHLQGDTYETIHDETGLE